MSSDYESTRRYNPEELRNATSSTTGRRNSKKTKNKTKNKNNRSNKNKNGKKRNKGVSIALKILKFLLIAILVLGILAVLIVAGIIAGLFLGLFGSDFKLTKEDLTIAYSNSEVYNADGDLLATLTGNEKRKIVSMSEMSEYLPNAYVAIEDERFYSHSGVDIKRTAAATVTYVLNGGSSSFGGSTITQQLVKNLTSEDEDTATRKIKEMAKALQVEKLISKDEILELYLNIIFVGGSNIHGVALGAEYYFNKDVSELDLAECAFMAGINNSPNAYDPFSDDEDDIEKIKSRTETVLSKMLELGFISEDEYNEAIAEVEEGLDFEKGSLNSGTIYSYVTECAIEEIITQLMEEKGMSRDLAEITVYSGGLKIYTTEDSDIQDTLATEMSKSKYIIKSSNVSGATSEAAMVIINHSTGEVVACYGKLGEKTTNGDLNRCTQILKQTGSSFKPLAVVTPALQEKIITAGSVYTDKKVTYGTYSPKNYDRVYRGNMTVKEAIEISCNTIQVQIMYELGVSTSIEYLRAMGFSTISDNEGLSLALGGLTNGVSPLEMAAAYATIANGGTYIEPTFFSKVEDADGNTVLTPSQTTTKVFDESVAYCAMSILKAPVYGSSGTATYCKISGIETAAKTGTTNDDYDRWLCGFTPYYTAACWYGFDKNETVHYSGSPSNPAGGIWSAVMKEIHSDLKDKSFTVPDGVVKATICTDSGLLPSSSCKNTSTEYFVEGTVPTKTCSTASSSSTSDTEEDEEDDDDESDDKTTSKKYTICADTGLLATSSCPNTKTVTYSDSSEAPTKYCTKHKSSDSGGTSDKNTTNTNTTNETTTPSTNSDDTPTVDENETTGE